MRIPVLAAVVAFVSSFFAAIPPASAGVPQETVTVTRSFVRNWVLKGNNSNTCYFVEITGKLRGTHRYAYYASDGGWDPRWYYWDNIKVINPGMSMVAWKKLSNGGCDSTTNLLMTEGALRMRHYSTSCNLAVNLSAGLEASDDKVFWGVSATPTVVCNTERNARYSDDSDTASRGYDYLFNGTAILYGDVVARSSESVPFSIDMSVSGSRKVDGENKTDDFPYRTATAYLYD